METTTTTTEQQFLELAEQSKSKFEEMEAEIKELKQKNKSMKRDVLSAFSYFNMIRIMLEDADLQGMDIQDELVPLKIICDFSVGYYGSFVNHLMGCCKKQEENH